MKKLLKLAAVMGLVAAPLMSVSAMPEAYVEGTHYAKTAQRLATTAEENQIEVVELFFI
jgi:hypothetical protein